MSDTQDKYQKKVFLFFMTVVCLIGLDLVLKAKGTVSKINQAVKYQNEGEYSRALKILVEARQHFDKHKNSHAAKLIGLVKPIDKELNRRIAEVYKAMGENYSRLQMADESVRYYTLALLKDPGLDGESKKKLAQECMLAKNFELGWISSAMAATEGQRTKALSRYFKKYYTGKEYAISSI